MLRISLIICTYNRAALLPRCLTAARAQTLPKTEYEIIVVDNGSTDQTPSIVRRFAGVRYLLYRTRGLSGARNAGAHAARAPIAAYIDDDAMAHPDLLRELLRVFDEHPGAGCVGGRIGLSLPPALPHWYSPALAGFYSGFDLPYWKVTRIHDSTRYPFGANAAYRVAALDVVGYFDTNLGRVGAGTQGGEDTQLAFRLARHGYEMYYNPAAEVEHVILQDRLRWSHIAGTARAAGRNWAFYESAGLAPKQSLWKEFRWLWGTAVRTVLGHDRWTAYSHHLFLRAKIGRKLYDRAARMPDRVIMSIIGSHGLGSKPSAK